MKLLFVSAPNGNNPLVFKKYSSQFFFFFNAQKKVVNISTPSFMQLTLFQVASQIKFSS